MPESSGDGLTFDLLTATPEAPVITGHSNGVITLDVEEAHDPTREMRRTELQEPYRTLLGHLRHESGHYYWQRLVEPSAWLGPVRLAFGDERTDYGEALGRHYELGPPADWRQRFVSAYASSHPWEDWAETWAHYLHMVDTLDTAGSFGVHGERLDIEVQPFTAEDLGQTGLDKSAFLSLINQWIQLTAVLNELSRGMGMADFYPFVLSRPAVRKLHLIHCVIAAADARWDVTRGCVA